MFAVRNTSVLGEVAQYVSNKAGESGHVPYPLAGVPLAFRKVNQAEPTSTRMCNIPGFEVSMSYSNMMKVPYQYIQLKSAGSC